uniref:ATP synthase complex subunit 8 n=1 Tax=Eupolyphaga sinensis TaxID=367774 RepID=D8L5B7_9NEOP|nr:ATP synthase F0 subunit 8 [Eupolyphaga sinensis]ACO07080.1 ATPase subunit 8 [Eupolyphaga sinensis]AVN67800.1 ATP synthase F0 subunit 8 [Eupolyphaga sinensis]QYH44913.1 ATP synthase F0 subunit 8 [Eupolyphaga sinensis]
MPQMMPLNWMMLYFMFIITLLMFNLMNYYLFNPTKDMTKSSSKIKNLTWKW